MTQAGIPMDDNTRRRKESMRASIVGKMGFERAMSLSDAEIERCLGGCAGRTVLIKYAKEFRDSGYMTLEQITRQ